MGQYRGPPDPRIAGAKLNPEERLQKEGSQDGALRAIADLHRAEACRVFATLIRILGDFDLAEEGLQEAFRAAVEQWPIKGVPDNPRAWLISTGRFKMIDALRRRARFEPVPDVETMDPTIRPFLIPPFRTIAFA